MKGTIYLAGPLFSEAEREFNRKLAGMLRNAGYEVFLPQEDSADNSKSREKLDNATLFKKNVEGIDKSDLVVAILDGGSDVDSGTAWEIGYAWARGIPIVGLRTDFRTLGIEGIVNLMIEECAVGICINVEELVLFLEQR
ncbi:nucleoside 2-deoxyribosyltransferase [Methanohalophilus levihalophilus]|uniref:nucleoside 2-deoxyribosyltransferase n=1 Tax=Methanohalophilus levihalophilus TaxID=1431282 RepID=UPI001AE1C024|nr:nucleoside 2-deoxyribosyltransferase [Methanohalophilus levihalophilus]MBP2030922.1 nucleoside 2-deoxyribosyltransferase [Methanohalophilus levihalophilus]